MTRTSSPYRTTHLILAKGLILAAASVVLAHFVAKDAQQPFWLFFTIVLFALSLAAGVYEFVSRPLARLLSWVLPLRYLTPSEAPPGSESLGPVQRAPSNVELGAPHALRALLVYGAVQFLVWVAIGAIAGLRAGSDPHHADVHREFLTLVPTGLLLATLTGGAVLWMLHKRYVSRMDAARLPRDLGLSIGEGHQLRWGFAIGAILSTLCLLLALLVPPREDASFATIAQLAATPGLPRLVWALTALTLAPPVEEFMFRGILLAGLRRSWGLPAATVVVTLVFVLLHLPQTAGYWPAILSILLFSVLAIAIRIRTGSLGPAVAAHFAYNFVLVAGVYGISLTSEWI